MVSPFNEDDDFEESSRLVVETLVSGDKFQYKYHLEFPEREFVYLGELKALREGIQEALVKMDMLINRYKEGDYD